MANTISTTAATTGAYVPSTTVARTTAARWARGRLRNGRVTCPRHGAAFDASTGRVISWPVRSVQAYTMTADDGGVYVECEVVP